MNKLFLLLFFTLILAGCASTKVYHEGAIPEKFSEIKATYGWFKGNSPSTDIRVNNSTVTTLIQQSVDNQLSGRGYKRVEPEQADYLISWFGSIREEVKEIAISQYYSSYGYGSLAGMLYQQSDDGKLIKKFSRGTLVLDVIDPGSKKVLWRGSATNTIRKNMSDKDRAMYIDISVKEILKTLPGR